MVRRPIRQERGPRRALRKPRRPRILKGVLHVHDVYSAWSGIDDRRRRADLHRTRGAAVSPSLLAPNAKWDRNGKELSPSQIRSIEMLLAWKRERMRKPIDRFLDKIAVEENSECLLWTGSLKTMGYGKLSIGGRKGKEIFAHRFIYEYAIGPIPDGMQIDHVCYNRGCVNTSHLRIVTPRENKVFNSNSASAKNIVKTHCPRGHSLDGENLIRRFKKYGWSRECRDCNNDKRRLAYHAKRRERRSA